MNHLLITLYNGIKFLNVSSNLELVFLIKKTILPFKKNIQHNLIKMG